MSGYDVPMMIVGVAGSEVAPGLDLDGIVSIGDGEGSCERGSFDVTSPRGERGVDNTLVVTLQGLFAGFIRDFDLDRALEDQLRSGERVVAIRVRELEDERDDANVRVDVLLVRPDDCASDVCAPGAIGLGRRWRERDDSEIAFDLPARVTGGRLRTDAFVWSLPFPIGDGATQEVAMRTVLIDADLRGDTLENGALGGRLFVDDLVAFAELLMPGVGETARGIFEGDADLEPNATDPSRCAAMSAGLGFSAVRGELLE